MLEGEPRLTGFDLAVEVGAPLTAHIVELDVVVDDGVLDVDLALGADGVDQAKLSALEVLTVDTDPPPPQPGTVDATPDALNFGSVIVGDTATSAVVLANPGEEPVTITALNVDDPQGEFALQAPPALPLELAAGAEVTLNMAFAPIDEGAAGGLLTVTHDGENGPLEVLLDGVGEAPPPPPPPVPGSVTATPEAMDFGSILVGETTMQAVVLANPGEEPVTISALAVDDPQGAFALQAPPALPLALAAGGEVTLTLAFAPIDEGAAGGLLTVTHDGADGPLEVMLDGFGEPLPPPPGTTILRLNAGLDTATTLGGEVWEGDAAWLVPGSVAGPYAVPGAAIDGTVDDVLYQTERYGNPFGYEIPVADATYRVRLHFAEIWHGVSTLGLAPGDRVFDVMLEGEPRLTGFDLAVEVGAPLTAHIVELDVVVDDGVLDVDLALGAGGADQAKLSALEVLTVDTDPPPPPPPAPGTVTATPDSLDFGPVLLDETATAGLVLANPGEEPVTISALAVDDPQGEFALQAPPALPLALAAGGEVTLTLAFAPIDEGAAGGLLTVTHDGTDGPLEVLLDGLGEAPPPPPPPVPGSVTATPEAMDFGSILVGETTMQAVVLANPGEEPVTISALAVDDPQGAFALQAPPALPLELAAGGEVTLTLAFAPIDEGAAGGLLTVTHDGADGPLEVMLDGFGEPLPPPPGTTILRLNAGLDTATTLGGEVWEGDAAWLVPGSVASPYAVPGAAIDGTDDDVLYQTERYGNPFGYEIPVADATYRVRLHFAEIWHGVSTVGLAPGDRVFDVHARRRAAPDRVRSGRGSGRTADRAHRRARRGRRRRRARRGPGARRRWCRPGQALGAGNHRPAVSRRSEPAVQDAPPVSSAARLVLLTRTRPGATAVTDGALAVQVADAWQFAR